jgi:hypothetical protein
MLAAYRGAADDEGETIAEALHEVDNVLVSTDRPFMPEASFVIEVDTALAAASLISLFRGTPLVTHVMTHARYNAVAWVSRRFSARPTRCANKGGAR